MAHANFRSPLTDKLTGPQSKHKTYHEKRSEILWHSKFPTISADKNCEAPRQTMLEAES